jgi:hypothetical protein
MLPCQFCILKSTKMITLITDRAFFMLDGGVYTYVKAVSYIRIVSLD